MRTKRVYIAAPYGGKGENVALNVRFAISAAEEILLRTVVWRPYVPHLFHLWQLISPHPYDFWMQLDDDEMRACQALVRIGGRSDGADMDMQLAVDLGVPVFLNMNEFIKWAKED